MFNTIISVCWKHKWKQCFMSWWSCLNIVMTPGIQVCWELTKVLCYLPCLWLLLSSQNVVQCYSFFDALFMHGNWFKTALEFRNGQRTHPSKEPVKKRACTLFKKIIDNCHRPTVLHSHCIVKSELHLSNLEKQRHLSRCQFYHRCSEHKCYLSEVSFWYLFVIHITKILE